MYLTKVNFFILGSGSTLPKDKSHVPSMFIAVKMLNRASYTNKYSTKSVGRRKKRRKDMVLIPNQLLIQDEKQNLHK